MGRARIAREIVKEKNKLNNCNENNQAFSRTHADPIPQSFIRMRYLKLRCMAAIVLNTEPFRPMTTGASGSPPFWFPAKARNGLSCHSEPLYVSWKMCHARWFLRIGSCRIKFRHRRS
jgi:hypothetical protein